MPAKAKYPVQRSFYCSHELSDNIDLMAKREGMTREEFIRSAVTVYIGMIEEREIFKKNYEEKRK